MYKAILFDCDGVLVDSEKGLSVIAADALNRHYGIPAVPGDFAPFIGMGEDMYIGGVVRKYGGVFEAHHKEIVYREYIARAYGTVRAFDGVCDLLDRLRSEGYRMAVASSADDVKVDVNLKILGKRRDFFDAVITGNRVAQKKPDPAIYLLAAGMLETAPEECVIVEDAVSGVLAGKNAGIDVIGFTSSVSAERLAEAGALRCIGDIRDLIGALR